MKYLKKKVKKVGKFIKRVNKHPTTKKIANIGKIAQMVKLLNVEKKRVDINYTGVNFSQFNGVGVGGAQCLAMSPVIIQGISGSTRNGNSLKMVSACFDFQISQQSSAINNSICRWYIVWRR